MKPTVTVATEKDLTFDCSCGAVGNIRDSMTNSWIRTTSSGKYLCCKNCANPQTKQCKNCGAMKINTKPCEYCFK